MFRNRQMDMGLKHPKKMNEPKETSSEPRFLLDCVPPNNGLIFNDVYLPEELIALILSFVDNVTLIKNCGIVCQKWYEIIKEDVWKIKAEREYPNLFANLKMHLRYPTAVYQGICCKGCYNKNLLKNNTGEEGLKDWKMVQNGDRWKIESPPIGVPLPNNWLNNEPTTCFVTSYILCSKYQSIDLCREGVHPDIMDYCQPDIYIEEWCAARWDCGSEYGLLVQLLDCKEKEISRFENKTPMRDWLSGWKKISHIFNNYGPGVRYIKYSHSGCDSQFWAGHYGAKMANATVRISLSSIKKPDKERVKSVNS